MLKSHLLHMAHLSGIRHLHKHHIHRHGHGSYGSHQKKGCGDFNDVASGHMNYMRNKALIGHGLSSVYGKTGKKKHMTFPLSGSGSKHIKPLKFKM